MRIVATSCISNVWQQLLVRNLLKGNSVSICSCKVSHWFYLVFVVALPGSKVWQDWCLTECHTGVGQFLHSLTVHPFPYLSCRGKFCEYLPHHSNIQGSLLAEKAINFTTKFPQNYNSYPIKYNMCEGGTVGDKLSESTQTFTRQLLQPD